MDSSSEDCSVDRAGTRRQAVVADLGQRALRSDDLEALLRDAAAVVADTLDGDRVAVLEPLPGGDALCLRQGAGWREDRVGEATVPTGSASLPGAVLESGDPAVLEDVRTDGRFSSADLLADGDVVAGAGVVIGTAEDPWGVLSAYATEPGAFTDPDVAFLRNVANVLAAAIENARSERRFEAVFEDPNILVGLLEPDGTVLDVNRTAMEYVDADLGDVRGEPFWETPWWGGGDEVRSNVRKWTERAAVGEYVDFETDLTRPDGERYTLSGVFRPVTDEEGEVVSIIVSDRDVTDRRRIEEELRESEAQFRMVAENVDEIVWLATADTEEFLYVNPKYEEVYGRDREELYEDPYAFADLIHPEDRERIVEAWRQFPEEPYEEEFRIVRPDGEVRWIHSRTTRVRDESGDVTRTVGVESDVTERKEREAELQRVLDLLNRTERIADVGGWEIDPDTTEVFWTDHIFELLEVEGDDPPPLDEALAMYHDEDQAVVEEAVEEALATGEAFDVEVRVRTSTDELRWLRLQGVPETVDGEVVSFRGAAHDITEHKIRERRLEEAVERLEASNERLEEFAYAASHDLQEPLRMVSSYLQLIDQRYAAELDEEGREFLAYAVDGAERMRSMIDGLLEYSRVETRGESFEPVDLNDVLGEVREDLRLKIEESGADLSVADLPRVRGDADQLRQVFQNLVDNAIEYSGEAPPEIHVSAERRTASDDGIEDAADGESEWIVSVRDEGIGVDPEHAEDVFHVFERLHTHEDHPGTGIGLALCERIVERHGGEIWIEAAPGDGTTVSLTLPAASDAAR